MFIDEFLDLMNDTLVVTPVGEDLFGDLAPIPSGQILSIPCYIEGSARLVRDVAGREVVSSFQAYLGGYYNLTVHQHQYQLPSRFDPGTYLTPITIQKSDDEEGQAFEVVFFP